MGLLPEWATNKKFLHATAVLIGTMVGVGIFGIPFAFAKAGFWIGLFFLIFAGLTTVLVNLAFAETVLRTTEKHQLTGYANIYMGPLFKKVVFFTNTLGIYGALLAYIIIAGEFLNNLFSQFFYLPQDSYSLIFFIVASILVALGIKTVRWVEFFLTILFISIILIIFGVGVPHINISNFSGATSEFWFLPYGVLLFAFAGLTSIPIQREIIRGEEKYLKKSIITAVSITGFLYLIFAITVMGVSGEVTSPDALAGLFEFLGTKIILLGSFFGIVAITTAYMMLGTALFDLFRLDYKIKKNWALLLVSVPPITLFLGGMRNFIDVIGLIGVLSIGLESVVLLFAYLKSKKMGDRDPEFKLKVPHFVIYFLMTLFLAGAFYELFLR